MNIMLFLFKNNIAIEIVTLEFTIVQIIRVKQIFNTTANFVYKINDFEANVKGNCTLAKITTKTKTI